MVLGKALGRTSVSWELLLLSICWTLISLTKYFYRTYTKWYVISICLVRWCHAGFIDKWIELAFSTFTIGIDVEGTMSIKKTFSARLFLCPPHLQLDTQFLWFNDLQYCRWLQHPMDISMTWSRLTITPKMHQETKQIDIRYHFVSSTVFKCNTKSWLSDCCITCIICIAVCLQDTRFTTRLEH